MAHCFYNARRTHEDSILYYSYITERMTLTVFTSVKLHSIIFNNGNCRFKIIRFVISSSGTVLCVPKTKPYLFYFDVFALADAAATAAVAADPPMASRTTRTSPSIRRTSFRSSSTPMSSWMLSLI